MLGCATTRLEERLLAAVGLLKQAPLVFEPTRDVPGGGVLCALPALLANGLLSHSREHLSMPEGFYPMEAIFLLLGFMALARVRSMESLRYEPPGEWGKLMGLDRIPEVKTLRDKVGHLCSQPESLREWSTQLAQEWMASDPESAGVFYADGHVRVYHGKLTQLPRRYVAREKLCLRGTTDYWINAMDGQPFFAVTQPVDPGLIVVLRESVIPRLLEQAPQTLTPEQLAANSLAHRFTMVFDRQGYSPEFFGELKAQRIAIITYHKFSGEDWSKDEFSPHEVTLVHGHTVTLQLAERGTCLSNGLWVREVRELGANGHQTSVITTDFISILIRIAAYMFARWCQENFLKYMREHFSLDRLVEYGTVDLPETTRVVNPAHRQLDKQVRKEVSLLSRQLIQFSQMALSPTPEPQELESWQQKKGQLTLDITQRRSAVEALKLQRKQTPRHLEIKDLPKADQFRCLAPDRKHFLDTIKLIAYRAETAMAQIVREPLKRQDDARALLRCVYETTVDLTPNLEQKTLTVSLHPLASQLQDAAVRHLCAELNQTETLFPRTDLRMVYTIAGSS